jgi:hypothetical protein
MQDKRIDCNAYIQSLTNVIDMIQTECCQILVYLHRNKDANNIQTIQSFNIDL